TRTGVLHDDAGASCLANLFRIAIKECGDVKCVLIESLVVGKRHSQIAGTDDNDLVHSIKTEDYTQVLAEIVDVITNAPNSKLAKVGKIASNLGGIKVELFGE